MRVEEDGAPFSGKDYVYPAGVNANVLKRLAYRMQWKGALENGVPYYWERDNPKLWVFHPTAPEEERILGPNLKISTDHLIFEAEKMRVFELGLGHYWTMGLYK